MNISVFYVLSLATLSYAVYLPKEVGKGYTFFASFYLLIYTILSLDSKIWNWKWTFEWSWTENRKSVGQNGVVQHWPRYRRIEKHREWISANSSNLF